MKNIRTKAVAVLAGVAVVGMVGAAAASLGPFESDTLGSGDAIVTSCDEDGVNVSYTTEPSSTANPGIGVYEVTSVVFSSVAESCDGLSYDAALFDGEDVELDSDSGTVTLSGGSFSVPVSGVLAADVEGVALVISG